MIVGLNEDDDVVDHQRRCHELAGILAVVAPCRETRDGMAVESTAHWYWLVDGLRDAGYVGHLAPVPALPQDSGLQDADEHPEARWLAHLLRRGLRPTGDIDPNAERALRDLLRKRGQGVRQKTAVVLSLQRLRARLTGTRFSLRRLPQLPAETLPTLLPLPAPVLSVSRSVTGLQCLAEPIEQVEPTVRHAGPTRPGYALLPTVTGSGPVLARTILLATGDSRRCATVGQFASSCRCVSSR